MPSDPVVFRLRADAWPPQERRMVRRMALTFAAALIILGLLDWTMLRDEAAPGARLAVLLGCVAVIAFFLARRRVVRARALWRSFEIALDDEGVTRRVVGFPALRIGRAELSGLSEAPQGLALRAGDRVLWAPRQLDGYDRLRDAVAAWRPAR